MNQVSLSLTTLLHSDLTVSCMLSNCQSGWRAGMCVVCMCGVCACIMWVPNCMWCVCMSVSVFVYVPPTFAWLMLLLPFCRLYQHPHYHSRISKPIWPASQALLNISMSLLKKSLLFHLHDLLFVITFCIINAALLVIYVYVMNIYLNGIWLKTTLNSSKYNRSHNWQMQIKHVQQRRT